MAKQKGQAFKSEIKNKTFAKKNNIDFIDTANAYGDWEMRIQI